MKENQESQSIFRAIWARENRWIDEMPKIATKKKIEEWIANSKKGREFPTATNTNPQLEASKDGVIEKNAKCKHV